jgi:DNA-binding NarL/FixJ family response regulator
VAIFLENNAARSRLKTFILENRELYRLLLAKFLVEKNGHEVVFFASPDELENNHDPRDFELMAAHLLPGRLHFKHNGTAHCHAVYGEGLDSATILWCRKSGVKGILDLQDGEEEWAGCLRAMGNGQTSETSSVSKALNEGHGKGVAKLSRREAEVARMLVKGFSAKQVAASLGTSEGTVKNQRKAVYRKLGIVRATQLAGAMGFKVR